MVETIRTVVDLNRDLIFFAYGLSFFVLGLAIALQSRSSSQLDLARSLTWLSAFGFAHGFHEWGDYFIPIQAAYLPPGAVKALHGFRLLLLAISFACLFEFGNRLLRPRPGSRALTKVNAALFGLWLFVTFLPLNQLLDDAAWHDVADALARYMLGFPGGLLAGLALRKHTLERITPLGVPDIVRMLRLIGVCLVIYAFLGGLVPPRVPFFPGNTLNSQWFERVLIVPPPVPRSILGLILAVTTIRVLEIFDLETADRLEAMEQEQMLLAEHGRLARELHDGAIQRVYTAGLLVESLLGTLPPDDEAHARAERAVTAINEAIGDLRHNLRELTPTPSEDPLDLRLRELVKDPRFGSFLQIELAIGASQELAIDHSRSDHILAIVNEALTNVVRHARADRAWIGVQAIDDRLRITVEDDGVGLPEGVQAGFGLRNMRDRARLLGGELTLAPSANGTQVTLEIPREEPP